MNSPKRMALKIPMYLMMFASNKAERASPSATFKPWQHVGKPIRNAAKRVRRGRDK